MTAPPVAPLRIAALYIHPVKGMRAVPVEEAIVSPCGLRDDRRWMVVDERGDFVTQREEPRLGQIAARVFSPSTCPTSSAVAASMSPTRSAVAASMSPTMSAVAASMSPTRSAVAASMLELSAPGRPAISIAAPPSGPPRRVRVWGDHCEAISAGDEAATWLSETLGRRCELVHLPAGAERVVDPAYASDARVGFADGFPFLIATTASLADVNARLTSPVDMRRFRPNLVIEGSAPFEEDSWATIASGDVRFSLVKPCARCVVITVDPDTAARGKEPLATMARYRARENEVYFGQNAVLAPGSAVSGRLRVGDPVVAAPRREQPRR